MTKMNGHAPKAVPRSVKPDPKPNRPYPVPTQTRPATAFRAPNPPLAVAKSYKIPIQVKNAPKPSHPREPVPKPYIPPLVSTQVKLSRVTDNIIKGILKTFCGRFRYYSE